MTDINYLMLGFNAELEKHAASVSEVGMQALKSALSGIKGSASKVRGPAAALGLKAMRGVGNATVESAGALKRFGERQVHSLTGWTPQGYMNPEGIKGMRAGAYDAAQRLSAAERTVAPGTPMAGPRLVDRLLLKSPEAVHLHEVRARHKELAAARKALQSAQKAEQMGLTSLPGYARAVMQSPAEAISTGLAEQWHGVGPAGKALMVGLPGLGAASELTTPTEPGGAGKAERVGTRLGELAYTLGPLPIAGQIAAGVGVSTMGQRFGKLVDKGISGKHVPAPPSLDPAGGEAAPGERLVSERALGIGTGGFQ